MITSTTWPSFTTVRKGSFWCRIDGTPIMMSGLTGQSVVLQMVIVVIKHYDKHDPVKQTGKYI